MLYVCEGCNYQSDMEYKLRNHAETCQGQSNSSEQAFERLQEAEANVRTFLMGLKILLPIFAALIVVMIGGGFLGIISDYGGGVLGAAAALAFVDMVGIGLWTANDFTRAENVFEKKNKARREYNQLMLREHQSAISRAETTKGKQLEK